MKGVFDLVVTPEIGDKISNLRRYKLLLNSLNEGVYNRYYAYVLTEEERGIIICASIVPNKKKSKEALLKAAIEITTNHIARLNKEIGYSE